MSGDLLNGARTAKIFEISPTTERFPSDPTCNCLPVSKFNSSTCVFGTLDVSLYLHTLHRCSYPFGIGENIFHNTSPAMKSEDRPRVSQRLYHVQTSLARIQIYVLCLFPEHAFLSTSLPSRITSHCPWYDHSCISQHVSWPHYLVKVARPSP